MLSKPIACVMGLFISEFEKEMEMVRKMNYVPLMMLILLVWSCNMNVDKDSDQSVKDLERAIEAIEDRQEAEYKIIEEQERIISILEENLDSAKSEGMRRKIRNDINEKRVIIRDAEKNLDNQKKVLGELYEKRDSLEKE
jgi:hypothetical protein